MKPIMHMQLTEDMWLLVDTTAPILKPEIQDPTGRAFLVFFTSESSWKNWKSRMKLPPHVGVRRMGEWEAELAAVKAARAAGCTLFVADPNGAKGNGGKIEHLIFALELAVMGKIPPGTAALITD